MASQITPACKILANSNGSFTRTGKFYPLFIVVYGLYPKLEPASKGALPTAGKLKTVTPLTTQSPLQPCGKLWVIVVERVARATLTNVDTFIDGLIDAPGLRPARDCR